MLKKKIILWMLVLWSCTAWITQARENISNCYNNWFQMACAIIEAWEEFVIKNDTNTITNIMNFDNTTYSNAIAVTLNWNPAYQSIIYWWNDGNPYTVFNRTTAYNPNWAYKINYLCWWEYENLTWNNSIMQYCWVSNNNTDNYWADHYNKTLEEIIQETQWKTPTNYIYHYYSWNDYNLVVCANYEDINYAWCIPWMRQTYTQWSNIYTLMTNWNTANIWITYMEENIWQSPIIAWWPWTEWWPISCVNIKTQIMLYWAKYNTWMCYTNGYTFSWNQLVQTWKLSIFDIYPSYVDFREALNVYSTYCNPNAPTTQQYCENKMSEYSPYTYQFYTYLMNANSNNEAFWVDSEKLYQYCHLQLNFTEEEKRSECADTVDNYYATWTNEETANGNPFEWVSEWIENNIEIAVPRTWTVFDEFLEWDTRIVGITDRFWNFKELYHKITWLFKYRWTQEWIIPWYITAMIMIILLLAIFKK